MSESVFLTVIEELAKSIEVLKYQLEISEKENKDLRKQVNDLYINIHIGKESAE